MRRFLQFSFGLLLALGAFEAEAVAATTVATESAVSLRNEADARILESILNDQAALFSRLQSDPETRRLPDAEKERRVREIAQRYETLLRTRPNEAAVMILYGKFLRLIDDRAGANVWFEKADKLMPDCALIKHQLGAYAAEEGRYAVAFKLLEKAVELESKTAIYHYHLGEFLSVYQPHITGDRLLTRRECDAKMQAAFERASVLNPAEMGYLWRFAESFFDCEKPDWMRALAVWDSVARKASSPLEREMASLYRARVLIRLGRRVEAERIVGASKSPKLEVSRVKLRELLKAEAAAAKGAVGGRAGENKQK
ncbi:MAG: hypothetical protein LBS59_00900 [Puniceicoccales bacterium]|nr:hypothetical protein [Puniceicoccales bacterium]